MQFRKPNGMILAKAKRLVEQNNNTDKKRSHRTLLSAKAKKYITQHPPEDELSILQEYRAQKSGWQQEGCNYLLRNLPKPIGALQHVYKPVKHIYLGGGGARGRAYASALQEAAEFGLKLDNIEAVTATSVGTIPGLMLAIGVPIHRMGEVLSKMPADTFQDFSLQSASRIFNTWGVCEGKAMPRYFRDLIKEFTDLDNPTFEELSRAGFNREFKVVTANLTKRKIKVFSYKKTPHEKVADIVAIACSVPIVFPPMQFKNKHNKKNLITDGGIFKNYPFGVEDPPSVTPQQQLGFMFVDDEPIEHIEPNKRESLIQNFWQYVKTIFSVLFTQEFWTMPEKTRERTVELFTTHDRVKFDASYQEQLLLNKSGKIGVRRQVKRMMEKKSKPYLKEASCQRHQYAKKNMFYQFNLKNSGTVPTRNKQNFSLVRAQAKLRVR